MRDRDVTSAGSASKEPMATIATPCATSKRGSEDREIEIEAALDGDAVTCAQLGHDGPSSAMHAAMPAAMAGSSKRSSAPLPAPSPAEAAGPRDLRSARGAAGYRGISGWGATL